MADALVIFFATLQAGTWASLRRLSQELLARGWRVTMACPEVLLSQVVRGAATINLGALPTGLPDLSLDVSSESKRRLLWRRFLGANSFDHWFAWVKTFLHLDLQGIHNYLSSNKSVLITDQFHAPLLAYAYARLYQTKIFVHESGGGFWHGDVPSTIPRTMIPAHFAKRTGLTHRVLAFAHSVVLFDEHVAYQKACDALCEKLVDCGLYDSATDVCLGLTKWWNLDSDFYLPRRELFFRPWKDLPYAADIGRRYITIVSGLQCIYEDHIPLPNVNVFGSLQNSAPPTLDDEVLLHWLNQNSKPVILAAFGRMSPPRLNTVTRLIQSCLLSNVRLCLGTSISIDEGLVSSPDVYHAPVLPQRELLASGRIHVFATHAGLSSCQEAILASVPMLFLPMQMDQFDNASRLIALGCGIGFEGEETVANICLCISWLLDRANHHACKSVTSKLSNQLKLAGDARDACDLIRTHV